MRTNHRLHGDWAIEMLDSHQIAMIKGKGGWNLDTALAYSDEFKKKATTVIHKPWVCIGYGVDWELGVPESEPVLNSLYEWMVENKCVKQISIILNPISKAQLSKYVEVNSPTYSIEMVSSTDELMASLTTAGFEKPIDDFDRFIRQPY